jgi:D-beta-D-heptose 7-phosphate kinase/D-beta-D-heptose 1-phosphate adenosyltransferase
VRSQLPGRTRRELFEKLAQIVPKMDAVIVSDYGKGLLDSRFVADLRGIAGEKIVTVDPKTSHFRWYRGATVVTPNLREAEQASGVAIDGPESLNEAAGKLLHEIESLKWLLITQGEEGMTLFRRGVFSATHIPTEARQVYDVTGAGDTVIATFTLGAAAGLAPEDAAWLANVAAGIAVSELGTVAVSAARLREALSQRKD